MSRERIVPVTYSDLLSLYGTMLKVAGTSFTSRDADAPGVFKLSANPSGTLFFGEPADKIDLGVSVTSATFYFVAGLGFDGTYSSEQELTVAGEAVVADARTLYKAVLAEGTVTISKESV